MIGNASISDIVLLVGALATVVTIYVSLRKSRAETVAAAAALAEARADRKTETSKMIDGKIADELKRLYAREKERDAKIAEQGRQLAAQETAITELKKSDQASREAAQTSRREASAIKAAVQRWWQALRDWDHTGRRGALPLPSDDDARRLELGAADLPLPGLEPDPAP